MVVRSQAHRFLATGVINPVKLNPFIIRRREVSREL